MWNALFVILGAALWATDTLSRHPLVQQLTPLTIVYYEHVFATLISFAFVLFRKRKEAFINLRELLSLAFVGVLGSAIATLLFTSSFQLINPSVAILLQKVQPVLVISLSALFLSESINLSFLLWAGIAIMSAFVVSFPDGFHLKDFEGTNVLGVAFALLAASLWAVSTVIGKWSLKRVDPLVASFYRFLFGFIALYFLIKRNHQAGIEVPFVLHEPQALRPLLYMAFVPGFLGVTLYYRGLKAVPASAATILELSFPLTALTLNALLLDFRLSQTQIIATGVLLLSMLGVSASANDKK